MATVEGLVVDATSGQPLPGAAVLLVPGNVSLTASTDSAGKFRIPAVPVGHYALRAWAVGFDTLEVPELWLRAGKQGVQKIELSPAAGTLAAVTISALAREQPALLGMRTFTVEQSLRWPATFQDPGRSLTATAGVTGTNDQANHLTIRGNSPNANAWLLEGLEIVNPNHTGNAGTPSDLPTLSGGGVTILSAQMLATSRLLTGVLPAANDNALGGILDMRLRDGNRQQQEWTAQAGLLGIDLATEGPLGHNERSSYLVNYRYSTIGLLSAFGVDLGDEAITFQDLSFHLTMPLGNRGEWHLFGMGGLSSNTFEAEHDSAAWAFDKDSRNIRYTSSMGAMGGRLQLPVGRKTRLEAAVVLSATEQQRTEEQLRSDYGIQQRIEAGLDDRKLAAKLQLEGALGARLGYTAGLSALERRLTNVLGMANAGWMLRPWLEGRWNITEHLQLAAGAGLAHYTFNGDNVPEPRATVQWRMRRGRALALAAGFRSQMPQWQCFGAANSAWPADPGTATRSRDLVLGYHHPVNDRLVVHVEAYQQQLSDVAIAPVIPEFASSFPPAASMINQWDQVFFLPTGPLGSGTNTGAEASVDHRFAGHFFYQANATAFTGTYTLDDGQAHDSRWNNRYAFNLFGGKEFPKQHDDRVRTWGISARINLAGGLREQPIDERLSATMGQTATSSLYWTEPLADYRRLDLRVYLKLDRKGRTGLWAFDLQNATNARNEAFHYYDQRKGEVVTKYQLGIIPNLSYRIEF